MSLHQHLYYREVMTGFEATSSKGPSISPLTLALLEDSSWYVANYEVSVETSFARGAGCQFAGSGCHVDVKNEELGDDYSGLHCSEIGEMGCDASHLFKAKCDFVDSLVRQKRRHNQINGPLHYLTSFCTALFCDNATGCRWF